MSILSCMKKNDKFVSIQEAPQILGVSSSQFYRLRALNGFPELKYDYMNHRIDRLKRKTARMVYDRAELEEWARLNNG